ncbi:MAG: hypothetical protein I3I98_08565 [Mobilibacterium timonense]|uniref:hypothetical protein n=1 Tax=Mobilibacterium timonense TaxID=1871012 RepID=UPI002355F0C1|nr:hypothetical protein [Mobilibacterium timonense]MBM6991424.1 hypothetical protein [Mobilibacterium timonense]
MEKYVKTLILFFSLLASFSARASDGADGLSGSSSFDWSGVMDAIIEVESGGRADAKSGNSVGAMQITPVLVMECNNILRGRRSRKRFRLSDRRSVRKSREMFLLFQSRYNPRNSVEWAIRSWNGGLRYSVRRTQRYFEKVMAAMR